VTSKWFQKAEVDKPHTGVLPLDEKKETTPVYDKVIKDLKKTKKKESEQK
jgi:hypothetical protein